MTIDDTEIKQNEFNEFNAKLGALNRYFPTNKKYIESKIKLLDNAKNFYGEKKLLKALKKEYFR